MKYLLLALFLAPSSYAMDIDNRRDLAATNILNGAACRVPFWSATDVISSSTKLCWTDATPSLTFGPAVNITMQTTDGTDNTYMQVSGGGAIGNDRGGYINLGGNEATGVSLGGKVQAVAGNVATGTFDVITGGGVNRLSITNAGNVGIGTTNPATTVDIVGSAQFGNTVTVSTFAATGALDMATGRAITLIGAGGNVISASSGTFNVLTQQEVLSCTLGLKSSAGGVITGCVASDIRLKKDVHDLKPSDVGIIDELRPVTYKWKNTKEDTMVHAGFIAQEVEKVLPQAVVGGGNGMKGVDPNAINAAIVLELQQLRKRVAQLERDRRIKR